MSRFADSFNGQIASEFGASQQYVAIAVHYDAQTLPQLAAHFYRQAIEERNHAMMIVQYLLDADAPVVIPAVAAPHGLRRRPRARRARARVGTESDAADRCAGATRTRGSRPVGEHFLGWFLDEQREEVASMNALLAVVDRAGTDNMLLVEDYLVRSGGVTADEPSIPAPPAAGGAL